MSNEIEQKLKKAIDQGSLQLPLLPAVAAQVMELARDPDSCAKDLADLILNDQSLAGHIMRVANSAAYTTVGQLKTLQQAITRLGMQQISQMALTMTVGKVLFKAEPNTQKITGQYWRHSLATAAWAREIARSLRENTEVAFLGGLLHQIGKPVALHAISAWLEEGGLEMDELTQAGLIDKYHKDIGADLARRWQLPEAVYESIRYIDDYSGAPTSRSIVTLVNAASRVAQAFIEQMPASSNDEAFGDFDIHTVDAPVLVELNLYAEDLDALQKKSAMISGLLSAMVL